MKKFLFLSIMLMLSACGTTSNLKDIKDNKKQPDIKPYTHLIIKDFSDNISKDHDDPRILMEGRNFADILASSIKSKNVFDKVERNVESAEPALLIDGEITKCEEGNAALRLMIGLGAGSSHFHAKVYFKDNISKQVLGIINIDHMSWALGGAIASTQDVKSHMNMAADKITGEIIQAKKLNKKLPSGNKK